MITAKPTEHMTGITIQGDWEDFNALVDAIHRVTSEEMGECGMFYAAEMHLLGLCYDIRHAAQGDREILQVPNGMTKEMMKFHGQIVPTTNCYFSANILFPEAIFVASAIPSLFIQGIRKVGKPKVEWMPTYTLTQWYQDKAMLHTLEGAIWAAFAQAVGDEVAEQILHMKERSTERYIHYLGQYIDKCNIEYIKTDVEKRKDKLRNIAKRIIKKPAAYQKMEQEITYWAKEYDTSVHELRDPKMEYPEDILW